MPPRKSAGVTVPLSSLGDVRLVLGTNGRWTPAFLQGVMENIKERPSVPRFGEVPGRRYYLRYCHNNVEIVLCEDFVQPYVEADDELLQGHVCKVNGCSGPTMSSGRTDFCDEHYKVWRDSGHRKKSDKAGFLLSFTTAKPLKSKQVEVVMWRFLLFTLLLWCR